MAQSFFQYQNEDQDPYGFYSKVLANLPPQAVPRGTPGPMPEPDLMAPQFETQRSAVPRAQSFPAPQEPEWAGIQAAPPQRVDPLDAALARRSEHMRNRPVSGDPQYQRSKWEKVAAMLTNAAAGYVNAGRRTHIEPIPLSVIAARPKFSRAYEKWDADGRAIDSDLQSLQTKYQLERQREADARAKSREQAYEAQTQARAVRDLAQATRPPMPIPVSGGYIGPNGKFVRTAPEAAPARPVNRTAEGTLLDPTSTPAQRAAAQKIIDDKAKNKGKGGGGREGGVESRFERQQERLIQNESRQELHALEKEEYGDPLNDKAGLHEQRSEIGSRLGDSPADADVDKLNRINNRLRMIYKRKMELGAITPQQYSEMTAGLKDAQKSQWMGSGESAKPRSGNAAPAGGPTKGAKKKYMGATYTFDGKQWTKDK